MKILPELSGNWYNEQGWEFDHRFFDQIDRFFVIERSIRSLSDVLRILRIEEGSIQKKRQLEEMDE